MSSAIRGAEPPYLSFLWREIAKIREAETEGDYAIALQRATSLIAYLPKAIKEKFDRKAEEITKALEVLNMNVQGTDIHTTSIIKHRTIQQTSRTLLAEFIYELTSELDSRGYMERKPPEIPTGFSRTSGT